MPAKKTIDILFEDDAMVVVNKPAEILSIPDRYNKYKANLVDYLKQKRAQLFIVHRLDKETSGAIVFAKNEAAHKVLSQQFEHREVEKYYLALLDGRMLSEEGSIDKGIAQHPTIGGKMIISNKGKEARTDYKVIDRYRSFTLVNAQIHTGRTHQIRVHFMALGHPLAIDKLYGKREAFKLSTVKRNYKFSLEKEEKPLMSRSTLHAQQLILNHPETEERMTFEAPLHKDFNAVLKQLDKWGR